MIVNSIDSSARLLHRKYEVHILVMLHPEMFLLTVIYHSFISHSQVVRMFQFAVQEVFFVEARHA
jgi:hypothetical protein